MLKVNIQTGANSTVSGAYVLGWVAESSLRLSSGVAAIRTVSAMKPVAMNNIYQKATLIVPPQTSQRWLFVNSKNDEDCDHGAVFVILSGAVGNLTADSKISFNINLDWVVEVDGRVTKPSITQEYIYAEDGYTPYFTDSSSDWAQSQKLTLKHKEGGSIVPFPTALEGVVYKFMGKTLPYVLADGKTSEIKYGVKIFNHYSNGLAVFPTSLSASNYAKSKSDSDCVNFKTAGDFVSPYNPAWIRFSEYTRPLFDNSRNPTRKEESVPRNSSTVSDDDDEDSFLVLKGHRKI